ncbi:MAG: PDZ domain-containing protein [Verrucomicrobiota bacterium]|nr:PDZ domain-containing protein [Verrucomicrobiota bacterium]
MRLLPAIIALLIFPAAITAAEDETRFNPPHQGSYLGIRIKGTGTGSRVDEILPGGSAERAGIEKGDIIVRVGNWRFNNKEVPLTDHLRNLKPGPTIIQVLRDGSELDLQTNPDPLLIRDAKEINRIISRNKLFRKGLSKMETDGIPLAERLTRAVHENANREGVYEEMNRIINLFKISHTAIITPWVSKNLFGNGDHFHLGAFFQLVEINNQKRYFVRSMMHGSPAREAGLLIGDEILSVNGTNFSKSPRKTIAGYEDHRKIYTTQVDRDETLSISFRRTKDGPVKSVKMTVNVPLNGPDSVRKSIREIPTGEGNSIGYIHLWDFMSRETASILKNALNKELQNSKALAIDLRGRGGRVMVINMIARTLKNEKRPIALLIDREARSAKEMLAHRLQGTPHVTLIGEKSAGAVLPANFFDLTGGAKLMIPNQRGDSEILPFMKNQKLEGRGAVPDVNVLFYLPFKAGTDPILDEAIQVLTRQLSGDLLRI